ncbi:uncharacterized protein K489DRAFT_325824 [Dissoconium aciculare CBS 342.82]|uniref:DUF6987 domain-containing protein n=1 Tax=Dissoconium aciculare CBS 342.82 TaxID=1314786 RepID=A0A6J3LWF6_9PEZI|nr:uncharacterized protein K489DRAFT_325824 [Dissoconium aciculare CBS 342.82]KAF1819609.1 hypothetical protein K489DRAFT_325824 [Dissoconium aciculare CBS 342.82]
MAPSPAPTGKSSGLPKTPTKLSRRPQGQTPQSSTARKSTPSSIKTGAQPKSTPTKPKIEGPASDDEHVEDTTDKAIQMKEEDNDDAEEEDEEAADDATQKVRGTAESTGDVAEDQEQSRDQAQPKGKKGGSLLSGARSLARQAGNLAGRPGSAGEEPGTDDKNKKTENAKATAGDATKKAKDDVKFDQSTKGGKGDNKQTDKSSQQSTEQDVDESKKVAGEGTDEAEETVDGADDATEDATTEDASDEEKPEEVQELPIDLSVLQGLEVRADGNVYDHDDQIIGTLVEGDAEDLEGYKINESGEIVDEDDDLVGVVELTPETIKKQLRAIREEGGELPQAALKYLDESDEDEEHNLPSVSVLKGLKTGIDGIVYDEEGNTIGRVVEGDPEKLQDAELNEQGEFVDDEGNVAGRGEVHEDAEALVEQGIYEAARKGDDEAAEVSDEAQADAPEIEDQLPGIEALKGMSLDEIGEIHDEEGNILGGVKNEELKQQIADGEIDPTTLKIDEQGQILDEDDNVVGNVEIAQEAAQSSKLHDLRILNGKKINSKGVILDDEGAKIGELSNGNLEDCKGKKANEKGEVIDKKGNVVGNVRVIPGEAAENATRELLEELGEDLEDEEQDQVEDQVDSEVEAQAEDAETKSELGDEDDEADQETPAVSILEGLKVNKKGQVLNEDREPIGELTAGELKQCAGKKINANGEVLDNDGKSVIGHVRTLPEQPQNPGVSVLEGLKVNKKGQVLNEDGEPIGELTAGEISQCAGKKINEKGEVLDSSGNVLGSVRTLPPPDEEPQVEAEEAEEEEFDDGRPPVSILEGRKINKGGNIIDENNVVIGQLVEGNAKKIYAAGLSADDQGQFWDNRGHVIGRAETVAIEDPEQEPEFAGLEGLRVVEGGFVQDVNGNTVGYVTEGDHKKLIGRSVDEDGDIIDKQGSTVGKAKRYEEEEQPEETPDDLSFLKGKTVTPGGYVMDDDDEIPLARVIEGHPKKLAGKQLDDQGQIWGNGKVIGRVELIPEDEREEKGDGPFAGLKGLSVIEGGLVADQNGNVVGEVTEGDRKGLVGLNVEESGEILNKYGEDEAPVDNSALEGKKLNKSGFVMDGDVRIGRLVEGNLTELVGRMCDENGVIHGDTGKPVGQCMILPENERVTRSEGVFDGLEGLRVVKGGKVEDIYGNVVGEIIEGDPKRLVGMHVDEEGEIVDKYGNVKGKAQPWSEEDPEAVDLSSLKGTTINSKGYAVDGSGQVLGRIVDGDPSIMEGKKVDGEGQVWDDAGNVIGHCELVSGIARDEGPFAGFEGLQINKDGSITNPGGDIVGRIIEGDIKKLLGHQVSENGDINDKNGNRIGKAERWEPEEKERRANPMAGMRVNKEGEVRDENGDLIGRLTQGNLGHCVGQEIDDAGNVVDVDGNKIGEVTLLENIDEETYEGPTEEELAEAAQRDKEREIAEKMGTICQQTLERMQPICKQISDYMEKADRTPRDELDEEDLVNKVKPLIEEGGRILQECNGSLRGLDPDGKIAAQAKGRAGTGEATPEEYRLAETLKELTTTVVKCIDDAKKKLNYMPHAKKKLSPLWALMTQPLFQILAAVGLLLAGVLGLVGQLLNGLGLSFLVNGLLGGLGINKLLRSFGLPDLGGPKKKSTGKSALSNVPLVGGLIGGK